ncbi:serine/threonine protein kinase [Kibdelosporangium banguiense]|uniref:non-specific serine/threonine protein kinase n=1 Tax=Kibdelosporangium banguiense TaxID=1365924 RepID=A0ABS4TXN6_9PSEU|nr:serine/threonine-protein kinase [Kibdelosporangium banguiense]MBP2328706.1 serine/threonine protein kinase [Kibdelosporangium banguiense]
MSPNGTWQTGRVVAGRYRLQSRVGAGAMGLVWRAADLLLDRAVAVKQLRMPPAPAEDEAQRARQRVFREARIAARLQHPHTVGIYDVITDDQDQPVLILEYLPSHSLAAALTEHGPLPPARVARIGAAIASALAAAHDVGVVHRDVKPGNILIADNDGTAKVTDFGLSHAAGDVTVTSTGMLAGTPAFLSPEAACGEPPTPASDVFSLGATLYMAVEGTPPFGEADNPIAQLHRVAAGHAPSPRQAGPLTRTLTSMLRDDPTTRPTMSQVAAALTAIADQPSTRTDTPAVATDNEIAARHAPTRIDLRPFGDPHQTDSAPATAVPPRRRRRITYALLGLLAASVLILLTTLLADPDTGIPSSAPPSASTAPSSTANSSPSPSLAGDPALLQQAVTQYYTLLPDNADQAWTLLGPAMQSQDREQYKKFWHNVKDLRTRTTPQVSGNTVIVEIEFTQESRGRIRETHRHTMLLQNSTPLINSDQVLSSQISKGSGNREGHGEKEKNKKKENDGGGN